MHEATLVKMPHCWKSRVTAIICVIKISSHYEKANYYKMMCCKSSFPIMCETLLLIYFILFLL